MSPPRASIHKAASGSGRPFNRALREINLYYASVGNDDIDDAKARSYVWSAHAVGRRQVSNSWAFANSAVEWAARGSAARVIANVLGWAVAGAHDKNDRTLGRH